jgi:hypothetical protein
MRAARRAIEREPAERRNGNRIRPDAGSVKMRLLDGRDDDVVVENISQSGAAVRTTLRPAVGSTVTLGAVAAKVVRHFDKGIAVEFAPARVRVTRS